MKIQYVKHQEINYSKWDKCISQSVNNILYAYSWYLDIVAEGWDALVGDDYKAVMPIPAGKKYGFRYVLQPLFAQQLGIFSGDRLSADIIHLFLSSIPQEFRLQNINLNKFNTVKGNDHTLNYFKTHELDLIEPYDKAIKEYSENTRRNIKKAITQKITIGKGINPNQFVDFIKEHTGPKVKNLDDYGYMKIRKIVSVCIRKRISEIYTAYSHNNTLCATAFFPTAGQKSIYLFAASSPEGMENRAMFLLIDRYIHDHSEQNLTLDFEGSNIESLARFYKGFGAIECLYPNVRKNNLPWYIKLFKKA
ncbi:MAG: hypothetical protein ABIJ16_12010 [Bacteroidota bacterium]